MLAGYALEDGRDLSEVELLPHTVAASAAPTGDDARAEEFSPPPLKKPRKSGVAPAPAPAVVATAAAAAGADADAAPAPAGPAPAQAEVASASLTTPVHRRRAKPHTSQQAETAPQQMETAPPQTEKAPPQTETAPQQAKASAPQLPLASVAAAAETPALTTRAAGSPPVASRSSPKRASASGARAGAASATPSSTVTAAALAAQNLPRLSGVFEGVAFILTGFEDRLVRAPTTEELVRIIVENGGNVVETCEEAPVTSRVVTVARPVSYRTEKFMSTVSRGQVCVHAQWVVDSVAAKRALSVGRYALPRGLRLPASPPPGAAAAASSTSSSVVKRARLAPHALWDAAPVAPRQWVGAWFEWPDASAARDKPLRGVRCCVLGAPIFIQTWTLLLVNAGASLCQERPTPPDVHIVVDPSETLPAVTEVCRQFARTGAPRVVSVEWCIQSLLAGKPLPLDYHAKFSAFDANAAPGCRLSDFNFDAPVATVGAPVPTLKTLAPLPPLLPMHGSDCLEFFALKAGKKRYEKGDFVFLRDDSVTAGDGARTLAHVRPGRLTALWFDPHRGAVRVRWQRLITKSAWDGAAGEDCCVMLDTGEVCESDAASLESKFVCVVESVDLGRAAQLAQERVPSSLAVHWRERVFVLAVPAPDQAKLARAPRAGSGSRE